MKPFARRRVLQYLESKTNGTYRVVSNGHAENANDRLAGVVELEERTWLPRHRRGDTEAFDELLAAYQRPIYSYLLRCGVAESAREDLFQDIFLKIHAAAGKYQPNKPLRPWIFTIAANTVRNYFRDNRRHLSWGEAEDIPDPQPGVDHQLDLRATVAWLEKAMTGLSLVQREVLNLAVIEGFRLQEAADILQMPLNTVKTHLRRARLALLEALASRDAAARGSDDHL